MGRHTYRGHRKRGIAGVTLTAISAILFAAAALPGTAAAADADPVTPAPAVVPTVIGQATGASVATFDQQLVSLINAARADAGVPRLQVATGLTTLSRWWSGRLNAGATRYTLAHNPDAWTMLTSYGAANRTTWGENVAWASSVGTSARTIFDAYMRSPGHRANILNGSFRYMGSGTVTGSRGLWNTTEFTDRVEAGQAPGPIADGDFVYDEGSRKFFRIAGGAPVLVTSFAPFGGAQPYRRLSAGEFDALPQYPRDGTFVADRSTGVVYRFAGGAPIYVSRWANVGGLKPVIWIDGRAIRYAGRGGEWNHVRWYPADNTYLVVYGHGAVFRVVAGRAGYLSSWDSVGGVKRTVAVDRVAIERAGDGGAYNHLK